MTREGRTILRRITALAVAVTLAVWTLPWLPAPNAAEAPQPERGAPVAVASVRAETRGTTIDATGSVVSRNDARLASEVAGRLEWIAEPGTTVAKGDAVARLDAERLQLAARDAEASMRRLAANTELLTTQRDRLRALDSQNIVSRSQLDEAESRVEMAQQELEQARVARDRAQLDLRRAVLRAPFAGQVAERLQQVGEFVSPGTLLARLVDTRNVEVVARAPLSGATALAAGQAVTVTGEGRTVTSRIRAIVPVGDERSRLLEVRIALEPPSWPIGSPVRVTLDAGREHAAITVPRDAIVLRQGTAYVYRVDSANTAERVAVKLGDGRGDHVEVIGTLTPGDRIIVRGAERLQPGQKVEIRAESERSAKGTSAQVSPGSLRCPNSAPGSAGSTPPCPDTSSKV